MTIDERLDRLTWVVESLAARAVAHNDQIANLIKVVDKGQEEMAELERSQA
jgi:hypothetical protein